MTQDLATRLDIRKVGESSIPTIYRLNRALFLEDRIINTFDREDLIMLLAYIDGEPVGFKIGYRESRFHFYSAKGGVMAGYRRMGIARKLLHSLEHEAKALGYRFFCYDTFPNRHPGMTVLGLDEGYRLVRADFNATYQDYRLRFEKNLEQ